MQSEYVQHDHVCCIRCCAGDIAWYEMRHFCETVHYNQNGIISLAGFWEISDKIHGD
jgi:hypothetical protein